MPLRWLEVCCGSASAMKMAQEKKTRPERSSSRVCVEDARSVLLWGPDLSPPPSLPSLSLMGKSAMYTCIHKYSRDFYFALSFYFLGNNVSLKLHSKKIYGVITLVYCCTICNLMEKKFTGSISAVRSVPLENMTKMEGISASLNEWECLNSRHWLT